MWRDCMVFSPVCCLSGKNNIWKEISLLLLYEEDVIPVSDLAAAIKQIKELQRLLGKKTMEVEILKEAVEYGQLRKWIAHAPLLPMNKE